MAYGLDRKKDEKIAVFDLGGGTLDVSILEVSGGNVETRVFKVLSTSGDTQLGGDDFDEELINYVADEFKRDQGVDLRQDHMAVQRLQEACEKAKKELSSTPQTEVNLPFVTADASGPKHLQMTITRAKFEELIDKFVGRIKKPLTNALEDAKLNPSAIDEVVLVGGSTRIPRVQQVVKDFFGKELHKGVNPDEVVAIGAAIQGSVLAGERSDVLLLDVTPLSLGIETEGGLFTKLVDRNTTVPAEKKQVFSTAEDNQTAVTVQVFQGERPMAKDNRLLGHFNLEGIPPAPRGLPQIEVKFDIDANGILNVSAKDLGTRKEASVRIEQSSGLDDAEIERMKRDAEQYADEDRRRRELIEARNQADNLCYQLEKTLQEHDDKLTDADSEPLLHAVEKVREAAKGEDAAAIKSAVNQLEQAAHAHSKMIYDRSTSQQPQDDSSQPVWQDDRNSADDVIDAEFEVNA